jgi:hypothetical protein
MRRIILVLAVAALMVAMTLAVMAGPVVAQDEGNPFVKLQDLTLVSRLASRGLALNYHQCPVKTPSMHSNQNYHHRQAIYRGQQHTLASEIIISRSCVEGSRGPKAIGSGLWQKRDGAVRPRLSFHAT